MSTSRPCRAALAGLFVLLAAAPAAANDPAPSPAAGPKGVGMAAPDAAYDTLRHELPAPARAPVAPPAPARPAVPLLLDTGDFGFGTSVVFDRMPSVRDIGDLAMLTSVQHVVVSLAEWPEGYEALLPLGQAILPEGADLIVILPGYPPSRAAAEAWNYLRGPLRIVLLVDGPPANRAGIDELNRIRGLERVIAEMAHPTRSGFERLQRPLSFRVVRR